MSDGSSGRPGQPGRPHRFYFDDLADEIADEMADDLPGEPVDEQPVAEAPVAQLERPAPRLNRPTRVDDGDDDLVDTGPIQVIRDPVPGSAAGQQLYFDDLAPQQHVSTGKPDEEPLGREPSYEDLPDELFEDDLSEDEEPPARSALALAGTGKQRPVGAVIAVLAVLALIGVLAAIGGRGHSGHPKQQAAAVGSTHPTQQATSAAPTHPSSSSGPSGATATSPRTRGSAHNPAPGRAPAGVVLTVLNNTTTQGLAKSAAQVFSTRGWKLGTVGNYAGQISVTTVYYNANDEAQHKAAQMLAAQFPGVGQVQPRFADLPGAGLTVVLAPGWHA